MLVAFVVIVEDCLVLVAMGCFRTAFSLVMALAILSMNSFIFRRCQG